jgi:transposase-like protein
MNGRGEKLGKKQEIAVMALLTEATLKLAAEKAGVSESTLYRWQQLDSFQEMFRTAKNQAVSQATARLQQSSTLAVDTLEDVMKNPKAAAMARVTAAKTVLEFCFKAYEIEEIKKRVEQLEEMAEGSA